MDQERPLHGNNRPRAHARRRKASHGHRDSARRPRQADRLGPGRAPVG
jgi:hypothetical protein